MRPTTLYYAAWPANQPSDQHQFSPIHAANIDRAHYPSATGEPIFTEQQAGSPLEARPATANSGAALAITLNEVEIQKKQRGRGRPGTANRMAVLQDRMQNEQEDQAEIEKLQAQLAGLEHQMTNQASSS